MNKLLLIVILAALCYLGYRARNYQPPAQRRIAPVGVFYLTGYVSAQTPTGVIGLTPGEEVRAVPGKTSQPNTRLVSDGAHEFEVSLTSLTDDMDVGEQLRSNDHNRQKLAAEKVAAEKLAIDQLARKRQIEMQEQARQDIERRKAGRR